MAYILKQNGDKKELFSGDIDFTGYKFNSKRPLRTWLKPILFAIIKLLRDKTCRKSA